MEPTRKPWPSASITKLPLLNVEESEYKPCMPGVALFGFGIYIAGRQEPLPSVLYDVKHYSNIVLAIKRMLTDSESDYVFDFCGSGGPVFLPSENIIFVEFAFYDGEIKQLFPPIHDHTQC